MATLYIIATPIGNLGDVTERARRVLAEVHALACEDTRRTGILLRHCEIARPAIMFSYHEHNEDRACRRILELLEEGRSVGICSNAGYPGVSDPGYLAVSAAVRADVPVEVIPGASAVQTALLLSGLPTSSYTFKGFAPRRPGRRRTFLEMDRDLPHTLVFFESPVRLERFLTAALEVYGDRQAALCMEMTKQHERVARGYLAELIAGLPATRMKGEATVVIAGNHPKFIREGGAQHD